MREAFEWLRWGSPANVIYRLALPEVTPSALAELSQVAESLSLRAALLVRAAGLVYFTAFAESEEDSGNCGVDENRCASDFRGALAKRARHTASRADRDQTIRG